MRIVPQSFPGDAILDELTLIRWLLIALLILVVVLVGYTVAFVSAAIKGTEDQQETDRREQFSTSAQFFEDKGDFEELENLCTSQLEEFPGDVAATWYLGLAQFRLGKLDRALQTMSKYRDLDPVGGADIADAYIDEIRAEMKGPRKHDP